MILNVSARTCSRWKSTDGIVVLDLPQYSQTEPNEYLCTKNSYTGKSKVVEREDLRGLLAHWCEQSTLLQVDLIGILLGSSGTFNIT